MCYVVTIKGKTNGAVVREYVFASSEEAAVRAMLGTPTVLGRYKFSAYDLVSIEARSE